jgi:hypothetical protein
MTKFSSSIFLRQLLIVLAVLACAESLIGQQSSTKGSSQDGSAEPVQIASLSTAPEAPEVAAPSPSFRPVSPASMPPMAIVATTVMPAESAQHHFWDRENRILFAAAGGLAAADFCVTRANLASGGKELNPMTRILSGSTPGLAANFAMETGGVIGASYLFHKTGHHKLERITMFVNIGGSAGAVAYGLTHR